MSIESIKARLEAADNVWYIRAPKCEATPATTDLRALLKVAEAAKQYIYGSDGDERVDYSALCAALAELEGTE